MKRFISLDILRGTAIFLMVVFHVPMVWYDRKWLESGTGVELHPLALLAIVSIVFFGAWAGFFLMVSSASNMVSMQRGLEKGKGPMRTVVHQVGGGLILLMAAFLVESLIGYHGYLGEIVVGNDRWDMVLWRGFHMETIHAIALCIMVNGAIMGAMSMKEGHRRTMRNVKVYLLLAVIVLLATPLVYGGVRGFYPGYPFAERWSDLAGRELPVQYPVIGETPFPELILKTSFAFLAGQPEPLFPYLSLSFLGSALGMLMCSKEHWRHLPKFGAILGGLLATTGLLGLAVAFSFGKGDIQLLADHFYELPGLYPDLWLWWFFLLSGAFVLSFVLVVRLIEMRGRSATFAKPTMFLRRYGFVAFTVYTLQFIYVLPRLVLEAVPCFSSSFPFPSRMDLVPVLLMVPMTVLLWEALLRSWQRVDFALGLEWFLAKVSEFLMPSKRSLKGPKEDLPWFRTKRLDKMANLLSPEWKDLVPEGGRDLSHRPDSKLSMYLTVSGALLPILLPLSVLLAMSARKEEGRHWTSTFAIYAGTFLMAIWSLSLLVLLFVPKVRV